jgi:hypothetical protein
MVNKSKVMLLSLLMLLTAGCACTDPPEADLMRENRKHLIESVRPALVDALNRAQKPDGASLYIDAYRDEKVHLLDRIITGSARVAPSEEDAGAYTPEPLPWKE